ncbi:M48 family metallopeptidase [Verticiella sediminum]|uniref:M48 family metallopeptidase n=2 Tax=Verticiella sediminum TaxID=1247510 RepID=A0A556AD15_9BURK|nr:M48 family metallopeptidase [Verticiella sediminum]
MMVLRAGIRMLAPLALVSAVGCAAVQTTSSGEVGIERKQYMSALVSEAQVEQAAAQQYAETLQEARTKGELNRDTALLTRVQGIAKRVIAQVPAFRADAANWQWQVNVIDSDEVNAWCMPGGRIAVYTGLVKTVTPTDDELAAVIGHEIAHALREHTREQMSQQMAANLGLSVLGAVTGSQATADLGNTLSTVMFTLPNSRQAETEADAIGLELAARAGYDPRAAATLWQKMAALGGGQVEFLSTHPSPASRIADLQQRAERLMPVYQQAKATR